MVSGAVEKGEEDCGGVVCGIRDFLFWAGVGAEGVVVCVGDFGVGGDLLVVRGVSGAESEEVRIQ